jgi:phosphocarrier protein
MTDPEKEFFRDISIVNEFGLHARAAAKIAAIAKDSKAGVWMKKDEHRADASSILDILTLCGEKGTRIRLIVKDPSDRHILNAIVTLIQSGFGE